jgi:hypothetical protein
VHDGSSSLLKPKDHLVDHPEVSFKGRIAVEITTLAAWAQREKVDRVDLLWLDLQGAEMDALRGTGGLLDGVRAIHSEVNLKETYEGATIYSELREWLGERGFRVSIEAIAWEDGGNVLIVRDQ